MKGAQELIGAPAEHGCLVRPKGGATAVFTGNVGGAVAGAVGRATADTIADAGDGGGSGLKAGAWSIGYLALAEGQLVLVQGKPGLVGNKATGVVARIPTASVLRSELGSGTLSAPLSLTTSDGVWELEVPRAELRKARALLEALG